LNVYGFTDIQFSDEGGASVMVERNGIQFPVPIISPEPGQRIEAMSWTGNPAGVVVTQADGQAVWVFVLHGRLFATRDFNANPHALWLSWAFSRPHAVQRFTGLRPSLRGCFRPFESRREHIDTETMKQRTIVTATGMERQYEIGPATKYFIGKEGQKVDNLNSRTWKRVGPRTAKGRGRRLRWAGLGSLTARIADYNS
jgi:hypothetical protein